MLVKFDPELYLNAYLNKTLYPRKFNIKTTLSELKYSYLQGLLSMVAI